MEFVSISGTPLRASRLGFGCSPLGGHGWGLVDDAEMMAAVRRAVDLGINFFDTADIYGLGRSEELLSRALGPLRHQVIIATKGGVVWEGGQSFHDSRPEYLVQALEGSLRRLKLEQVPLYYVHWPDRRTPIEDTLGALDRLKQQGKIGAVGISNFNENEVATAAKFTLAACQNIYNFLERDPERRTLPFCKQRHVTFVSASSLAMSLLTGKYGSNSQFDDNDQRSRAKNFRSPSLERNLRKVQRIKEVARRLGHTPTQVALRWLLDVANVDCALTGIKTVAQLTDNIGAIGWSLEAENLTYLTGGNSQEAPTWAEI